MISQINTKTGWTNTFQMLADEFGQMYGERPAASLNAPDLKDAAIAGQTSGKVSETPETSGDDLSNLYRNFHAAPAYPRTALCLSGGGGVSTLRCNVAGHGRATRTDLI